MQNLQRSLVYSLVSQAAETHADESHPLGPLPCASGSRCWAGPAARQPRSCRACRGPLACPLAGFQLGRRRGGTSAHWCAPARSSARRGGAAEAQCALMLSAALAVGPGGSAALQHRAADPATPSPIAMAALPRLGFGSGSRRHRRAPVSDPASSCMFWLSRRQ